jgi:hypothetical protein
MSNIVYIRNPQTLSYFDSAQKLPQAGNIGRAQKRLQSKGVRLTLLTARLKKTYTTVNTTPHPLLAQVHHDTTVGVGYGFGLSLGQLACGHHYYQNTEEIPTGSHKHEKEIIWSGRTVRYVPDPARPDDLITVYADNNQLFDFEKDLQVDDVTLELQDELSAAYFSGPGPARVFGYVLESSQQTHFVQDQNGVEVPDAWQNEMIGVYAEVLVEVL